MNQVTHFVKMRENVGLAIRNICLNSDGSELIYLNSSDSQLYLRFYQLDTDEANNYDLHESSSGPITRLKLNRKLELDREYLPGICLSKIGQLKIGVDSKSLVIFDVGNLNMLVYGMDGKFRSILLRAEEYLGNVMAFSFTGDQLHIVTVEFTAMTMMANNLKNDLNSEAKKCLSSTSGFEFKLRLYKIMECECHKNLVNKRNIYHEREKTADFEHPLLTDSFEIFNF